MQAVQAQTQPDRPSVPIGDRRALARRTRVQQLARVATRGIQNRKQRMAARIALYNELLPMMERHHRTVRRLHRTYLPLIAGLGLALTYVIALD